MTLLLSAPVGPYLCIWKLCSATLRESRMDAMLTPLAPRAQAPRTSFWDSLDVLSSPLRCGRLPSRSDVNNPLTPSGDHLIKRFMPYHDPLDFIEVSGTGMFQDFGHLLPSVLRVRPSSSSSSSSWCDSCMRKSSKIPEVKPPCHHVDQTRLQSCEAPTNEPWLPPFDWPLRWRAEAEEENPQFRNSSRSRARGQSEPFLHLLQPSPLTLRTRIEPSLLPRRIWHRDLGTECHTKMSFENVLKTKIAPQKAHSLRVDTHHHHPCSTLQSRSSSQNRRFNHHFPFPKPLQPAPPGPTRFLPTRRRSRPASAPR